MLKFNGSFGYKLNFKKAHFVLSPKPWKNALYCLKIDFLMADDGPKGILKRQVTSLLLAKINSFPRLVAQTFGKL